MKKYTGCDGIQNVKRKLKSTKFKEIKNRKCIAGLEYLEILTLIE